MHSIHERNTTDQNRQFYLVDESTRARIQITGGAANIEAFTEFYERIVELNNDAIYTRARFDDMSKPREDRDKYRGKRSHKDKPAYGLATDCQQEPGAGTRRQGGGAGGGACYNYNQTGHLARDCPQERRAGGGRRSGANERAGEEKKRSNPPQYCPNTYCIFHKTT